MTDIVTFGSDKPPWRPSRRLIGAAIVALAAGAGVYAVVSSRGGPAAVSPASSSPAAVAAAPPCPAETPSPARVDSPAGLAIGCATGAGGGLDRRDRTASDGPWTVVVRRADGSLGRHGAVVTFPVDGAPPGAHNVTVGGIAGEAASSTVAWPVGESFARVRGDLSEAELIAIGAATTVVDGKPAVNPPAGFAVAGAGPYRPPDIHEIRYGSGDVGELSGLGGGLTFTGVFRGGGFEDRMYLTHPAAGPPVDGRPSVVTSVFGGNGALAWEPAPGVVAYVGYSGGQLSDAAVAALGRLAGRARVLTDAQWRAIGPTVADQSNEPG